MKTSATPTRKLRKWRQFFYASVLLFIINFVIRLSKYLWIHEAITNTSANETIFISPWKRHRENGLDAGISTSTRIKNFPFSCACAHAYALLQRVKVKYRSGITQAQGSLQHVVMFVQWKHWIQITSRLNSFIKHKCSDGLILVLCRISFSLGSSLLLVFLPALVLAWLVKKTCFSFHHASTALYTSTKYTLPDNV